jgi:hypothetical protein
VPTVLSLFFQFSRLTSHVAAWIDVVLFGTLTPVMLWRTLVWQRVHRSRNGTPGQQEKPPGTPEGPGER